MICSAVLGIWTNRWHHQRRVVSIVTTNGGTVRYDYQTDGDDVTVPRPNEGPNVPHWLLNTFDVDAFSNVVEVEFENCRLGASEIHQVLQLPYLRRVVLTGAQLDELAIGDLRKLSQLENLFLSNTSLTDAELEQLVGLKKVRSLGIDGTQVTDKGLSNLAAMKTLEWLVVDPSQLTATGIINIKAIPRLTSLWLQGPGICSSSVADLPNLTVLGFNRANHTSFDGASLPKVRHLHLHNVTAEGVIEAVPKIGKMSSLANLHFSESPLTDQQADDLAKVSQLARLTIYKTGLSTAAKKRLQMALPTCEISPR